MIYDVFRFERRKLSKPVESHPGIVASEALGKGLHCSSI